MKTQLFLELKQDGRLYLTRNEHNFGFNIDITPLFQLFMEFAKSEKELSLTPASQDKE